MFCFLVLCVMCSVVLCGNILCFVVLCWDVLYLLKARAALQSCKVFLESCDAC